MKKIILILLPFLAACSSGGLYWPLTHFNLSKELPATQDSLELIYTCGSFEDTEDKRYVHHILVSLITGDTINVLSPGVGTEKSDPHNLWAYVGEDDISFKLMMQSTEGKGEARNNEELKDVHFARWEKVSRDPAFDYIANNQHPTVIGFLAKKSKTQ